MSESTKDTVEYLTVDPNHGAEDTPCLQQEPARNGQAKRESRYSPRVVSDITSSTELGQEHTNEGGIPLSTCSSSSDSKQAFQSQLKEQVTAARHGHRGLETALNLICERMLTLEDCWEMIMEVRARQSHDHGLLELAR